MSLILNRRLMLKLILFLTLGGLLVANQTGPPPGHTGGYGGLTCNTGGCHNSFVQDSGSGSLAIEGLPASYQPNTSYQVTVRLSQANPPGRRWGFQMAARFSPIRQAGSFTAGAGMQVMTMGGIQYISHNLGGTRQGQAGPVTWTFTWTSPAPGNGPVQFNVAGNAANNDSQPIGDYIYTREVVVPELAGPPPCIQPNSLHFAQFANGDGFTSSLTLPNAGTTPVTGCLDASVSFPLTSEPPGLSTSNFTIPPGGAVRFSSDGQGTLAAGYVRVGTSAPGIGGVIIFRSPGLGATGVPVSPNLTGFIIPVDRFGSLSTGLAMVNFGTIAVTVNLALNRLDGTQAATGLVQLAPVGQPGAQISRFIEEIFGTGVTTNFTGTVVARVTGGSVAATGVRIDVPNAEFTTLPVTPLQ